MFDEKKEIYVGNLEYSVTEDDLRQSFVEKGVNVKDLKIIKDKYSGRSKGFGFVEVGTDEEIQKAIETLDGVEVKGRKLKLSMARKPQERSADRGDSRPPRFNKRQY